VPFTVTPLLRVVPEPVDVPPVEVPGEELAAPAAEPPEEPPLDPPLPAANACGLHNDKLATMTIVMSFMTSSLRSRSLSSASVMRSFHISATVDRSPSSDETVTRADEKR